MGIRVSHLFLPRETAISVLTADHEGQGSHQTPTSEKGHTDLLELEKKLFSIVKKVKFSHFDGLEEALLETVRGDIPKYLKDIARKIQAACGITETRNVHHNILMLVYAAVYEMEQCKGVELLNWDRLSKWVATCNQAKDAGFQVKFVEEHLKKILYAFHGFGLKMSGGDPKKRVWELEVELEMMRECLSAEESFKGKPLSHGLFSQ
ncbi:hypothetical protein CCACVL1_12034 [Corchorus capsularis]|uniref:Uncharacterized protein n=1 Tax=Corchorus capsularis TaxID=210143 RepID=A0A1R3II20_COCAP|nr:hypothetical protein CCACVL1_12034 [Corchorus capsularis]